jgi:two-component system copper resistance phosphate regulon response regulator CusR
MTRILVVEDEQRVAELLKVGLEDSGYQVSVAFDGEMGLRLFRASGFDLVISDIILPTALS